MTAGIIVDKKFLVDNKAASAAKLAGLMRKVVPKWFGESIMVQGNRIIIRPLPPAIAKLASKDPLVAEWANVQQSMVKASNAGEWRLVSGASVDQAGEDGAIESLLRLDPAERDIKQARYYDGRHPGERIRGKDEELSPKSDDPEEEYIAGFTAESEVMHERIVSRHKGARVALERLIQASGREGIVIVGTRRIFADGWEKDMSDVEIAFTIIHELASHAGGASDAAQNAKASTDFGHHKQADIGQGPADRIDRFLKDREAEAKPPEWDDSIRPPTFLQRLKGLLLKGVDRKHPVRLPPRGRGTPFQDQLRLHDQQLRLQNELQQRAQREHNRIQESLQHAARQRMQQEMARKREQQLNQAAEAQARDQARLRDMLNRQSQDRVRAAADQARRSAEVMRRQAEQNRLAEQRRREAALSTQRNMGRPMQHPMQSFVRPFVSRKLWENSASPDRMFPKVQKFHAPKPQHHPRPIHRPIGPSRPGFGPSNRNIC